MDVLSLDQEVGAWDSVLLDPLTEETFIANLHQRFKRDHIYTYIGNVLVSINPYKKLALYSKELVKAYRCRGPYQLPPHMYAIAGSAYRFLRDRNEDQCIVLTGESGSGKTEAARIILQFLTLVSQNIHSPEVRLMKDRLTQSSVLLEAFGNAKTNRNDNASRFGKYLDIEFDYKGDPLGGKITNYLLEKSRVTNQNQGDRNFHIFYQLLTGADVHLLKALKLQRNIDNYSLLSGSCRNAHLDNVDDKRDFHFTKRSMEILGFSQEEIINILKIVASVLKLGNIIFIPTNNIDGTEGCTISNDYELHEVHELIGTEALGSSLTRRKFSLINVDGITKRCHCENGKPTIDLNKMHEINLKTTYKVPKWRHQIDDCHNYTILRRNVDEFRNFSCGSSTNQIKSNKINTVRFDVSSDRKKGECEFHRRRQESGMKSDCDTRSRLRPRRKTRQYELYEVCDILDGEPSSVQCALTCRMLDDSGDVIVTELSASEATYARDSLCKALYSRLFTYLVNKINDLIKVKRHGRRKLLGILDVYGFETFEKNGFEQFIINFCNEKLQQVITNVTLKEEQEEYIKEGIDWVPIDFSYNETVCDLIEKNNHGILSMLDEECVKCGARSDELFLAKLAACCSGHPHFEVRTSSQRNFVTSDNNLPINCFRLKHFAGTVTYSVQNFVERNRDVLSRDLSQAMYNCSHPLLKTLFPEGNPKRASVKRPATTGAQFKISISALVRNLTSKQPHYVRCIKPNELKQPRIFEIALVQHQVRYLGLLETVRVRRQGFCYKLDYQTFLSRYKMLSLHTWPSWNHGSAAEGVSYLLRDLPIPSGEFAFGRNKIFVRSPRTVFELEEFRRERLYDLAVCVQKTWRSYRHRKRFLLMRESQVTIASAWRSWRAREEFRILKHRKQVIWAVIVIQKHYIKWKQRQYLLRLARQLPFDSESPICRDWPICPPRLTETSILLMKIHHKWRCHKYRLKFDQTARNRMREKVTASIIFKDRKASYPRSVSHPFLGDYVRLRQNVQWKKISVETNDQYVVFADIINKITRSSGKFVPILFVLSTSSMLILDQRTLQVKYRVPASEIYRISLSPYLDDVAVFHVRAPSPCSETLPCTADHHSPAGCLFQSDLGRKKGDFVFQTGHVIEIVTKLFLVVQNAVGKPPEVNITTDFEANFGQQTVLFTFKCTGLPEVQPGQIRIMRKGNKMEVLV